ncbi:Protein of unknown function [Cyclobacterium lianum]|uniref:DUF4235 domain-containing protein n=1 Tax=Cyclobacterium lianum TaxID=388280 RepID=A0A1M7PW56_9BACT|nr:DUF4235 domain-containing protein [Cyclobacterium lianum]SHN21782.1 Protein of unknown function [Cyclobacterium lianum]
MKKKDKKQLQELMIVGGTLLGTFLVRRALEKTWEKSTGKEAPKNPYEEGNSLKEVLAWTIATGLLVSVTKVFIRWGVTKGSHQALDA